MGEAGAAAPLRPEERESSRNVLGGQSGQLRKDRVAVWTAMATQACRNVALGITAPRDLFAASDQSGIRLRRHYRRRQSGKMPREIAKECRIDCRGSKWRLVEAPPTCEFRFASGAFAGG
ncbi:hypothetical protein [Mesorhizobium waimense]|uniref:hypothetical protein n=1 Tax=Mesorhizobium waimense TaxID=1300307 RepID=UPI00142E5FF8|nr:hypothetical protein [Mesorhizobium waimense]